MKLPVLNGNELVPVRLIPLLTHDSFGQETLSGILANRLRVDGFRADPADKTVVLRVDGELTNVSRAELGLSSRCAKDINVFAYHLNENSEPVKMLSIEWDNIYRNISVLEPVLRKEEERIGVHDALFSEWSLKATKILPPGVFLWRHDLDAIWKFHYMFMIKWSLEHTDARILNYDAYIRPEDRGLYFEGFEPLISTGENRVISLGAIHKEDTADALTRFEKNYDPGLLLHVPVQNPEQVEAIDIPLPEAESQPVKQLPGRIYADKNLSAADYIKKRRSDKPPATNSNLVYELRKEMSNGEIGKLLDIGSSKGDYRKNVIQRMFRQEAEKHGTADEVIKGRKLKEPEPTVTTVAKLMVTP